MVRTYIERWPRKDRAPEKVLIIVVEPDEQTRDRCPECGQRGKPVERDVKRWRTLDVHGKRAFLEAELPRIVCGEHGKITAAVPWARHDDRFSRPFEEFAAWKAAHMAWSRAAVELRITWEALANITARVAADAAGGRDRLAGLARIGIDEKSWGKGSGKFLVIVTDHDSGHVVWAAEGRSQAVVRAFFGDLGPDRARLLTHVSADGAEWIHPVVREKAPQAEVCLDAFHVVKWAGEKLDELRRRLAGELRAAGRGGEAATLGTGMWALRKDYRKLSPGQRGALADIAALNKPLYKGYLIKEQIREAFKVKGADGSKLMRGVTAWAHRCRIPEFTKLAKTLSRYKASIEATLAGGPSNGRAEALNSQINALITRARGFRSATALMNMILFVHGGICPDSPYA
ncbi:MAG: ISL3 family transposase [Streptosporangiaceae bacterium]